jgi:hypothetical protein
VGGAGSQVGPFDAHCLQNVEGFDGAIKFRVRLGGKMVERLAQFLIELVAMVLYDQ